MPKGEVLYCKGMDMDDSDSGAHEDETGAWDDTALNMAYDRALKLANPDVAKRIAMATNSNYDKKDKTESKSKQKLKKQSKAKKWSAGMACRAIYDGDGIEYEAFVTRILNDNECIVRFLGYDNSEIVEIDSLKPSLGQDAQQLQIEQAVLDNENESEASTSHMSDDVGYYREETPEAKDKSYKKKNSKRTKSNMHTMNGFQLPDIPMPDISKLRNMASMDLPMPPPPPMFAADRVDGEDQAISSMLLSWYMSGYYTGLYQGLKRAKSSRRHK